MGLFDIVLLIIIAGFAMFGIWFGFIHTLGSLLGTAVGAFVATRYSAWLATWIVNITGWSDNTATVLSFVIVFMVSNRVIGFLFWMVDRFFKPLTNLPFISSLNRLLGLVLGVFEGMITLGLIFFVIEANPVSDTFMTWINESRVVPYTIGAANVLMPLIPDALKEAQAQAEKIINSLPTQL
ncbi:MAG: Colicin V production protein [uncultured bacterium]|nr:MAG: Colicin V production protein [uncultured bacterium]